MKEPDPSASHLARKGMTPSLDAWESPNRSELAIFRVSAGLTLRAALDLGRYGASFTRVPLPDRAREAISLERKYAFQLLAGFQPRVLKTCLRSFPHDCQSAAPGRPQMNFNNYK
jgi:hypothetical protein